MPVGIAVGYARGNAQLQETMEAMKAEYLTNLANMTSLLQEMEKKTETEEGQGVSEQKEEITRLSFEISYQNLYPDLYIGDIPRQTRTVNTVYLTFDDGPSPLTEKVLDVLQEKGVKATFFVIGKHLETEEGKRILNRIVQEGHTVGIHTYSHVYGEIYQSVEAYLEDFYKAYDLVYGITGVRPEIFRFPGGSINGYNGAIYQELIAEMTRRGFVYYDWNVSSQDTAGAVTQQQVLDNVVPAARQRTRSIILMHDSAAKKSTLLALSGIIDQLAADGYQFEKLTRAVTPIIFGYCEK